MSGNKRIRRRRSLHQAGLLGGKIAYLLRDLFTHLQTLPAATNTFLPDRRGLWEVEQLNGATPAKVDASELILYGSTGAGVGDQGDAVFGTDSLGNPYPHEAGLVFGIRFRVVDKSLTDIAYMAIDAGTVVSATYDYEIMIDTGFGIKIGLAGVLIDTGIVADSTGVLVYEGWICLSNDGKALFYADLEQNGYATLYWIAEQQVLSTVYNHIAALQIDLYTKTAAVALLGAETFDPDIFVSGVVDESTSGNAPDGDSTFEFVLDTVPSADSILFHFRIQDATNYWQCEINSAGDYQLDEIVDGTPTNRINDAAALSGTEILKIRSNGIVIQLYYDETLAGAYSAASNFAQEIGYELDSVGTGGQISDLRVYKTNLISPDVRFHALENVIYEPYISGFDSGFDEGFGV